MLLQIQRRLATRSGWVAEHAAHSGRRRSLSQGQGEVPWHKRVYKGAAAEHRIQAGVSM